MKRICALLLCTALLLALAGCPSSGGGGGGVTPPTGGPTQPSPYDAYRAAVTALAGANGLYGAETRTLLTMGSASVDIHLISRTNGREHYTYSWFGSDSENRTTLHTYVGGMAYVDIDGQQAKSPISEEDFYTRYGVERLADPGLLAFSSAQFLGVRTVSEIGGYYFSLRAAVTEGADEFLRGVLGESAYEIYRSAEIGEVSYVMHFYEDGTLRSITTHFDMLYADNTLTVSTATVYTDIGTGGTIPLPQGAAAYPLVAADQLPR